MIELFSGLSLACAALALAGSHALAFRTGRKRAEASAAVAVVDRPILPPPPVLVVNNDLPAQDALRAIDADFSTVPAYVSTLLRQIDGVKTDAEDGIALVIGEVNAINGQAREQIARMHASLDGSQALARSSARPGEIIGTLQATLDERTADLRNNFDSLSELAHEFQTLRPIIETISTIADQAYFLSINAAIEAARAGPAGVAFSLVAGEVRALSKLTQAASKDIGVGITTFTARIHEELDRARPQVEKSGDELDSLIGELGEIQQSLVTAGEELTNLIHEMDGGHRHMVDRLSTILGHVQFQDVIRQRLDQVGEAIDELGDHIRSRVASARAGETGPTTTLEHRLVAQQSRYVMHSQRAAYVGVVGGSVMEDAAPRIELF